jgi:hypothetical protein
VAQIRYASRLPRVAAKQDYLSEILPRIAASRREKVDWDHNIVMPMEGHHRIIQTLQAQILRPIAGLEVSAGTWRFGGDPRGLTPTWDNESGSSFHLNYA